MFVNVALQKVAVQNKPIIVIILPSKFKGPCTVSDYQSEES